MYKSLLIFNICFILKSSVHHSSRPQRLVRARGRRDGSSLVKIAQPAERSTVPGIQRLTFRTSNKTTSTTAVPPTQCPHQAHGEEDPGRSKKNQFSFHVVFNQYKHWKKNTSLRFKRKLNIAFTIHQGTSGKRSTSCSFETSEKKKHGF